VDIEEKFEKAKFLLETAIRHIDAGFPYEASMRLKEANIELDIIIRRNDEDNKM